jgi:ubiquinone/menaquinone biosynthesis C-methylase UbiE
MVTLANRNLQAAGPSARAEVRQDNVAALPFDEAAFDLAISTFSIRHWAAVIPAVTDVARVLLRRGGRLWMYDLRAISRDTWRWARPSAANPYAAPCPARASR